MKVSSGFCRHLVGACTAAGQGHAAFGNVEHWDLQIVHYKVQQGAKLSNPSLT